MAKVLTDTGGIKHLRGAAGSTLCRANVEVCSDTQDGVLTCPDCAKIALHAVELVTKAEKREWRKL